MLGEGAYLIYSTLTLSLPGLLPFFSFLDTILISSSVKDFTRLQGGHSLSVPWLSISNISLKILVISSVYGFSVFNMSPFPLYTTSFFFAFFLFNRRSVSKHLLTPVCLDSVSSNSFYITFSFFFFTKVFDFIQVLVSLFSFDYCQFLLSCWVYLAFCFLLLFW